MRLPALLDFRGSPEFTTDGCSGYMTWAWVLITGRVPPWNGCCVTHDMLYWDPRNGGTWSEPLTRRQADLYLFIAVSHHSRLMAWLMWLGCRVGGSQYLPFAWRWRYREPYLKVVLGI